MPAPKRADDRRCSVDGCDRRTYTASIEWCRRHYLRAWRNNGNPAPERTYGRWSEPEQRFWSRVTKTDGGCWLYDENKLTTSGYGRVNLEKREKRAHVYAWELRTSVGVPQGFLICHTCDVRNCVRNDDEGTYVVRGQEFRRYGHLWIGTVADNTHDMIDKGRRVLGGVSTETRARALEITRGKRERGEILMPYGEGHPNAKLTDDAAFWFIRALETGMFSQRSLATIFGISTASASQLARRAKRWRDIEISYERSMQRGATDDEVMTEIRALAQKGRK